VLIEGPETRPFVAILRRREVSDKTAVSEASSACADAILGGGDGVQLLAASAAHLHRPTPCDEATSTGAGRAGRSEASSCRFDLQRDSCSADRLDAGRETT